MTNILKTIWNISGSRNLSVFIFIMGLTYVLFLAVFSAIIPAWWVENLSRLLPFKVLYILFFINLLICEIKWIPAVVRRCRKPEIPLTGGLLNSYRCKVFEGGDMPIDFEGRLDRFITFLKRRGYSVSGPELGSEKATPDTPKPKQYITHAYRGRFSQIGNILFHCSFLFFLAGIFISIFFRFDGNLFLMEGQEYSSLSEGSIINENIGNIHFEVGDIETSFWKDKLLFTQMETELKFENGTELVSISKPVRINGARITMGGLGYTPKFIFRKLGGRVEDMAYVNLLNFVPGTEDHFKIPGYPYKIFLSFYPDYERNTGKITTKSMNMVSPAMTVRIVRNKIQVYSGLLRPGDEAFFDGYGLEFPEIKYNATFRIIKDRGLLFIWSGFILMIAGLVWKMFIYRREVLLRVSENRIYLYTKSDYHQHLFERECEAVLWA